MPLSRTWKGRLTRWRAATATAARAAVVAGAVLGAAAGCKVFLTPDRPDIAGLSQQSTNRQAQVGGYAADFIQAWLTATTADSQALQRFISITPETQIVLPATPAAVVTAPTWLSVIADGSAGDATVYAVTVSVLERPYSSAEAVRAFYRVAVVMWNYQPRVMDSPARISGPGPGVNVAANYPKAVATDTALHQMVSGFLTAYLTTPDSLDRYVLAGSGISPVAAYSQVVITSVASDVSVPQTPTPGTQLHVLARVTAQTSQFSTVNFSYPLTVENHEGTWMVAAIDLIPQVNNSAEVSTPGIPQ